MLGPNPVGQFEDAKAASPQALNTPLPGALPEVLQSALGGHIAGVWGRNKTAKQEITERLLANDRQRSGIYDPDVFAEIQRTGGSEIFMQLTDIKCRASSAWIKDVMRSAMGSPYDLKPSPMPDIPPELQAEIAQMVTAEAEQVAMMGMPVHPLAFRIRTQEIRDQIIQQLKEQAKKAAARMTELVDDELHEGGWHEAFDDFIDDFCTHNTAFMKGPVMRKKKCLKWGPDFSAIVTDEPKRKFSRVSPYNIFPSKGAASLQHGAICEFVSYTPNEIEDFRGIDGSNDDEISKVLERFGSKGYKEWLGGESERRNLENRGRGDDETGTIDGVEFWGPVFGSMLLSWGMDGVDPLKTYEIHAVWIAGHVIRCIFNPDPLGRRPYACASFIGKPGTIWGESLPEKMRDVQRLCNAAARALMNNMAIASGPMVEANIQMMAEGENPTVMYPWRVFQTKSDPSGAGNRAISFHNPQMHAQELMTVYTTFSKQSDEVTGVPNYIYGSTAVSGAGRTASGLSMLLDNAAKGLKDAIGNTDRCAAYIIESTYIHIMMYHPDNSVKGDFQVKARGILGALQREALTQRQSEYLAATANPIDAQIIGPVGRAYLHREVVKNLELDVDKIVPAPEAIPMPLATQGGVPMPLAPQAPQQAGQQAAPATLDAAGNPAGGPQGGLADGGRVGDHC